VYGTILTYALVLLPALWIVWSVFNGQGRAGPAMTAKS
jgi:hypothetical protein